MNDGPCKQSVLPHGLDNKTRTEKRQFMEKQETFGNDVDRPILLALSTFRQSDELVEHTIQAARRSRQPLIIAFVVDVNLPRYFTESGAIAGTPLREQSEKEMLEDFRRQAATITRSIEQTAQQSDIPCSSSVVVGRFGVEILMQASEHRPSFITLTRSKRPDWVRRLFGSPVDSIIRDAGCPVYEDFRCRDLPDCMPDCSNRSCSARGMNDR